MEGAGRRQRRLGQRGRGELLHPPVFGQRDRRAATDRRGRDTGRPFEAAASLSRKRNSEGSRRKPSRPSKKKPNHEVRRTRRRWRPEAKLFLPGNDAGDLALQHRLVVGGRGVAAGDRRGVLEDARPQQAADDLGAKRRRSHCCRLGGISGISGISDREPGVPCDSGTLPIGGRWEGKLKGEALVMAT